MENKKDFLDELNLVEDLDNIYEIQNKNFEENNISNTKIDKEKHNIINEEILLNKSEEELKNELEKLLQEAHKTIENQEQDSKIFSYILGFFRYITTSTLIFAILLLTTNYSAYYNIAKSYIFKDELKQEQNSILNSVSAAQITKKIREKKKIEKNLEKMKKNEKKVKVKKYSIKKLTTIATQNTPKLDIDITPYENRIIIPKIAKNVPLLDIKNQKVEWPKQLENIFMKELENWVIRYPWSTKPGRPGNTFIFGHSSNFPWIKWDYNDVFALLDKVSYWDKIIMYYNQKKYIYEIREKRVIKPWDVSVLKRNKNKDELTLMTCWPIWTTLNRLIVTWELIEE